MLRRSRRRRGRRGSLMGSIGSGRSNIVSSRRPSGDGAGPCRPDRIELCSRRERLYQPAEAGRAGPERHPLRTVHEQRVAQRDGHDSLGSPAGGRRQQGRTVAGSHEGQQRREVAAFVENRRRLRRARRLRRLRRLRPLQRLRRLPVPRWKNSSGAGEAGRDDPRRVGENGEVDAPPSVQRVISG